MLCTDYETEAWHVFAPNRAYCPYVRAVWVNNRRYPTPHSRVPAHGNSEQFSSHRCQVMSTGGDSVLFYYSGEGRIMAVVLVYLAFAGHVEKIHEASGDR